MAPHPDPVINIANCHIQLLFRVFKLLFMPPSIVPVMCCYYRLETSDISGSLIPIRDNYHYYTCLKSVMVPAGHNPTARNDGYCL